MSRKSKLKYRSRMGSSWFEEPMLPDEITVSLTVPELAQRLGKVARTLHKAYRNPAKRLDNIVVALNLLDILQAAID